MGPDCASDMFWSSYDSAFWYSGSIVVGADVGGGGGESGREDGGGGEGKGGGKEGGGGGGEAGGGYELCGKTAAKDPASEPGNEAELGDGDEASGGGHGGGGMASNGEMTPENDSGSVKTS